MSPTEFEIISDKFETMSTKIDNGFHGVHARIDTFKDDFNNHRIICADLFSQIRIDEATRKGEEKGIAKSLKDRIDWGKVKTALTIAVGSLLSIAAVKIIFTNIGKFTW